MHGHDETGLYYLHADRLGSTMATTNGSGNTVDDHGYYAYACDRRGSELRTDRRFTGRSADLQKTADRRSADNDPRFSANPRFYNLPCAQRQHTGRTHPLHVHRATTGKKIFP